MFNWLLNISLNQIDYDIKANLIKYIAQLIETLIEIAS